MSRRRLALAVLMTLAALTPLVAHAVGSACWIYLPAHVPVLVAGLGLGLVGGAATGVTTAIVEILWGRMGLAASAPIALEILTYGLVSGAFGDRARVARDRWIGLVAAMIAGRAVYLVLALARGRVLLHNVDSLFVRPWPGMLLQLLLVPLIATAIARWTQRRA